MGLHYKCSAETRAASEDRDGAVCRNSFANTSGIVLSRRSQVKQTKAWRFLQTSRIELIVKYDGIINAPDNLSDYVIPIDTSDWWWEDLGGIDMQNKAASSTS